jgi:hypothetical protein
MANENKKRPLVLLDAANPSTAPIDIHQTQRSGWGEVDDGAPRLTFDQVEQFRDTGKSGLADNSNVDTKPNSSPTQPNTNQASNSTQPKSSDYLWDDILAKMDEGKAYRVRTPEEIEAQRKADKRNALFSAIGDGVSALSNLYFTTKGAPSVERGGKTLSEAQQAASDKWWKDEKEAREAYIRNRLNALRLRQQRDYYDWRQQNGDDKLEADRKYKNDQIENKKREAERKERQDKFNNTIKMLTTLGNITDKQQRAVQKWYEDAARGIKSEFPSDVSSAVKDALKSQFPELIDGIDFKPVASTPAVTPVVVSTPSGKGGGKSGGSGKSGGGGGRGGGRSGSSKYTGPTYSANYDENGNRIGWIVKGRGTTPPSNANSSGSGGSKYGNTKKLGL